jgi:DNA-binding response OmpR family regulator
MKPYNILVVDDEKDLCEILQYNLETVGYNVDVAYSAEEALKMDIIKYDLLLLDVMMGVMSGFKMASILNTNSKTSLIKIVFLSGKDSENDKITGFALGAEDYIVKPFSIREVLARIKTILRRLDVEKQTVYPDIIFKKLEMSISNIKVLLDKKEIHLTKTEFEILRLLLENKNCLLTREDILSRVWSNEYDILDRTIDVNITRLRKKLGIYEKNLVTRLGYGYCMVN